MRRCPQTWWELEVFLPAVARDDYERQLDKRRGRKEHSRHPLTGAITIISPERTLLAETLVWTSINFSMESAHLTRLVEPEDSLETPLYDIRVRFSTPQGPTEILAQVEADSPEDALLSIREAHSSRRLITIATRDRVIAFPPEALITAEATPYTPPAPKAP